MTYQKAVLDIELFDVEDVITTSASAVAPAVPGIDTGAAPDPAPQPQPEPPPQPQPQPDFEFDEEWGDV